MIHLGLAIALAISSTAAVSKTQFFLRGVPTADQQQQYLKGIQGISMPTRFGELYVAFPRNHLPDGQSNFLVGIQNSSGKPVTIGPENITIEITGQKALTMTSAEDLEGRARRDLKRRTFFSRLGTALAAGNADGRTSGTFDGTVSSYGSNYSVSGIYSGHDPALAAQQQRNIREQADRNEAALAERAQSSQRALTTMLQTTTVQSGQLFGGIVAFDAPRGFSASAPTIVVTIEGQRFRFPAVIHATEGS